jgi:hypothetical protein
VKPPRASDGELPKLEKTAKAGFFHPPPGDAPTGAQYEWYRQRIFLGIAMVVLFFVALVGVLRACS